VLSSPRACSGARVLLLSLLPPPLSPAPREHVRVPECNFPYCSFRPVSTFGCESVPSMCGWRASRTAPPPHTCVTAIVKSRFSTACHHPCGTNIVSPAFCKQSTMPSRSPAPDLFNLLRLASLSCNPIGYAVDWMKPANDSQAYLQSTRHIKGII
jgi:hypothetical protein